MNENVHFKDNNVVVILRDLIQPHWDTLQETQQMGTSVSTPMRGPTSTLSLTQFLQKFLICLGSGYREIGPFQPMHVDRGLLNCPTSPSHEKQTKSDQTKISLCQSSDWIQQGQKSLSKKMASGKFRLPGCPETSSVNIFLSKSKSGDAHRIDFSYMGPVS